MDASAAHSRLLETFLELVRIDSPSKEEAACASYCAQALAEAGCLVRFDDSASVTGSNTGNLIAELPGTADSTLILSAHLDVVEPCRGVEPVVHDGLVVSAGDTVLGADDKSGLATAIEVVRRLAVSQRPHATVRCVFTVQEEVGLRGAKELDRAACEAELCLVLDADGTPGGIVVGAPTHYTFTAVYTGKASHAGVAPEKGVSAIAMAADAVSRLQIGRIDEQTTANIGTMSGGTATNVIAAQAVVTGECRSHDRGTVESLKSHMDDVLHASADRFGGSVDVKWELEYEGFAHDTSDPLLEMVAAAVTDAGREPRLLTTGGGSDANVLSALGVPTLALSCGMQGVHGTSEQIEVADLEALADICEAVAYRMGQA